MLIMKGSLHQLGIAVWLTGAARAQQDVLQYVDPLIGTANGGS